MRIELTAGEAFAPVPVAAYVYGAAAGGYTYTGARALRGSTYVRGLMESRRLAQVGAFDFHLRTVLAGATAGGTLPQQRAIFLAGADPYETFTNPFLRSRGALFAGDAHYQASGGGDLRGFSPELSARWLAGANVEVGRRRVDRPTRRLFNRVTVVAFADGALLDPRVLGRAAAGDAGIGLRASHRIGPTSFVTRVDLPLVVSSAGYAVGARPGDGRFKLRAVWSLEEAL